MCLEVCQLEICWCLVVCCSPWYPENYPVPTADCSGYWALGGWCPKVQRGVLEVVDVTQPKGHWMRSVAAPTPGFHGVPAHAVRQPLWVSPEKMARGSRGAGAAFSSSILTCNPSTRGQGLAEQTPRRPSSKCLYYSHDCHGKVSKSWGDSCFSLSLLSQFSFGDRALLCSSDWPCLSV